MGGASFGHFVDDFRGIEVDGGDRSVDDDFMEARPLRLRPDVVVREGNMAGHDGEELVGHGNSSEAQLRVH